MGGLGGPARAHRLDQHDPDDLRRVRVGKHPHRQTARRVPHHEVRPRDVGVLQQSVQLLSEVRGSAR